MIFAAMIVAPGGRVCSAELHHAPVV